MTGSKELDTALEHDAARKGVNPKAINEKMNVLFDALVSIALGAAREAIKPSVIVEEPEYAKQYLDIVSGALQAAKEAKALSGEDVETVVMPSIPVLLSVPDHTSPGQQLDLPFVPPIVGTTDGKK